jgi:hypothetical protein
MVGAVNDRDRIDLHVSQLVNRLADGLLATSERGSVEQALAIQEQAPGVGG